MSTHKVRIDGDMIEVQSGTTVLAAATQLGVTIPTLCYREGGKHFTSCMVCVVEDTATGRLIPACSAPVTEGMLIDTTSDAVRDARRAALELLLSDHVGDCEGPCQRVCTANMNIPLMIREIAAGQMAEALVTVKRDIPLPAILGRVCPAPCESGCRRRQIDSPVSICLLKRIVADIDLGQSEPYRPAAAEASGKRVAIVGAGPAGLSAAYYLALAGHECTLLEKEPTPGGALRDIDDERLPRAVLDGEIGVVLDVGIRLECGRSLGSDVSLDELSASYDAVALTCGPVEDDFAAMLGLEMDERGLKVDRTTFETARDGVFATGGCVVSTKLAVRAVGEGKDMAVSLCQYLAGEKVRGPQKRFNSVIGRLLEGEGDVFMQEACPDARVEPAGGVAEGMSPDEAVAEAKRCLHCDCRKPNGCKLRDYASQYGAMQGRYKATERRAFEQRVDHPEVIFEQGKCISCGLCIRVAQEQGEELGLSFVARGIETRIGVPFGESLGDGLKVSARDCVAVCPTGALSFPQGED